MSNECTECGLLFGKHNLTCSIVVKKAEKAKKAKLARKQRDDLMRSMGLVKVKGAVSGRTYWE